MRNKREHIRRAVVLILTVAGLIICTAPFSALSGLAFAQAAAPSWSATLRANGKIAFTSDRDGNREIYVMNADGTNPVRLTNNSVFDDHPTWSPDGTKIAFVSQKQDGGFAIFAMNADGTARAEITSLSQDSSTTLSWSPDGGKIAFDDSSGSSVDIFVVNVDGSGRQDLTADHADSDLMPVWSPDGSKILFSRYDMYDGYGDGTMLHTINPDGTNLTRLLNGFADGWNEDFADWSSDKIVYAVNVWDFFSSLYIANPDGTGRRYFHGCDSIFTCRSNALHPRFSPDGSKIVFYISDNFSIDYDSEIYVKNIDGSGFAQLTNMSGRNFNPSWQPLAPAACPNPIDCADFFVRQQYLDFLSREPDQAGFDGWMAKLNQCPAAELDNRFYHLDCTRIDVSAAFFRSREFSFKGYYVYRFYQVSFGRRPAYSEFIADTARVTAATDEEFEQRRAAFPGEWVTRQPFKERYDALSNSAYVNTLLQTAGVSLAESNALVDALNNGQKTRAQVIREVVESAEVEQKYYDEAFVAMQYFSYLRRDPDADGYNGWLNHLNGTGNYREMVWGFLYSPEYKLRFGPVPGF